MRVFVEKKTGRRFIVLDWSVVEGRDAWYVKSANISLPKSEWREQDERI